MALRTEAAFTRVQGGFEMDRDIYITEFDLKRLVELVQVGITFKGKDDNHLQRLQEELDRAHVVETTAIPQDVVTMNSRVRLLDVYTGEERLCALVFPSDADIELNKISILAPIGTAMLGYRVGDMIEWEVPGGLKQLRIAEILYQPEAAGHYHL
jgi:regulator of nucleoside diphosphate kinase